MAFSLIASHVAWLARGIEQLGRGVAAEEVELEWMVPLLVEAEKDRPLSVTSQEGALPHASGRCGVDGTEIHCRSSISSIRLRA